MNKNIRTTKSENDNPNTSQFNSNIILDQNAIDDGLSFHEAKTYFNERARNPKSVGY